MGRRIQSVCRARGMELDFGGIGKEYAADRAAIDLPGPRHRGTGSSTSAATCALSDRSPTARRGASASAIRAAPTRRSAASSSRDGARRDERRLRAVFRSRRTPLLPLLDARTGVPVAHWQSVSVVAPLAILAGSYATIAMLLAPMRRRSCATACPLPAGRADGSVGAIRCRRMTACELSWRSGALATG